MNRSFLRWFYIAVQFVMLAVSIPKVATLYHAYDKEVMGPLVAGVDLRSWLVGLAIDLTATFTTWAAMAKYEESRKRSALLAPAIIILFCSALSVIANYEDAATQHPGQYAGVSLFTQPALVINPLLISAPPVLVLLLILLVPSVLARPRIKSADEIEAEADEQVARIRANARVRDARVAGLRETVRAATATAKPEEPELLPAPDEPIPDTPDTPESPEPPDDDSAPPAAAATAKMTRAMWQAMKLTERVTQSGLITTQEAHDVLGISVSLARNLLKDLPTRKVDGRSGVSYGDLIESLYTSRAKDASARARKLEMALGVRKRARTLQVVPDEPEPAGEPDEFVAETVD